MFARNAMKIMRGLVLNVKLPAWYDWCQRKHENPAKTPRTVYNRNRGCPDQAEEALSEVMSVTWYYCKEMIFLKIKRILPEHILQGIVEEDQIQENQNPGAHRGYPVEPGRISEIAHQLLVVNELYHEDEHHGQEHAVYDL